jgi:hypothetical protein
LPEQRGGGAAIATPESQEVLDGGVADCSLCRTRLQPLPDQADVEAEIVELGRVGERCGDTGHLLFDPIDVGQAPLSLDGVERPRSGVELAQLPVPAVDARADPPAVGGRKHANERDQQRDQRDQQHLQPVDLRGGPEGQVAL